MNAARTLLWWMVTVASLAGPVFGQVSEDEHAQHHPEQAQEADAGGGMGGGSGMGGMMEGMGAMMEKMGSPPPKELFPTLMELETLPLDQRAEVRERAHDRMKSGTKRLGAGLARLGDAASGDDFAEMQSALGEMREGLAEFESGLAAHRALAEGQPPTSVALQWFKREMSLLDQPAASGETRILGLSAFHFFTMSLLTGFAVVMIGMYFRKMRRATAVLEEIASRADGEPHSSGAAPAEGTAVLKAQTAATVVDAPEAEPEAPPPEPPPTADAQASTPSGGSRAAWSGTLRLGRILDETPEIRTFRLLTSDGAPIPFRFLPGQFLTVSVVVDGKSVKRAYTIASSPTISDYVEITVKREAMGAASRFLHDELHEGDELAVRAPNGVFTFTGAEAPSIVLIGGGVGITPLMSVIRYLTDRAWPGEITLIYCCRSSADFVFREELEFRQRRHPNLNVVATMTREAGTVWMGPTGRLTKELLFGSVPEIANRRVHVCGPPPMMDAVLAMLRELDVPDESVKTEAFGPAKKTSGGKSASKASPSAPSAAPVAAPGRQAPETPPAPAVTAVGVSTVHFARSGKSAPLPAGTSILDVADELGIEIENSCRSGICGSCTVALLEGSVEMETEDGLEPADKQAGFVLACQAVADADVTVDA